MSSPAKNSPSPSPSKPKPKICFNFHCKEPLPDPPPPRRLGWRLRSGEYAELCLRCSCAFEQGNFCEAFHSDATGWRKCESCGKRVHCGCVASASTYLLLDAGGVECILCAKKSLAVASNQVAPSSAYIRQEGSERREINCQTVQSSLSGLWRRSPQMWNLTSAQSDMQQRLSLEFDKPKIMEKLIPGVRHYLGANEKKTEELTNRITPSIPSDSLKDNRCFPGSAAFRSSPTATYHKEGENANILHDSKNLTKDNDPGSRKNGISDPLSTSTSSSLASLEDDPFAKSLSSSSTKESKSSLFGSASPFRSLHIPNDSAKFYLNQPLSQVAVPLSHQSYSQGILHADLQAQAHKGIHHVDARMAQNQLIPRSFSRTTVEELHQISAISKSVITPLFEKILSASDVGRIGRLVIPKKCAMVHFPKILHPDGLPLKVQDSSGKEWSFQFRFWPHTNGRMYVLEGITPCIQAMQLQAGDTVTFSRIDPEGKLVMGFRKATCAPADKESQAHKSGNEFLIPRDDTKNLAAETSSNLALHASKVRAEMKIPMNTQECGLFSQFTESGFTQKGKPTVRPSHDLIRRKKGTLGSNIKRLRMKNEDSMELKLTWEEAQKFLCPPRGQDPSIVVIEGHEFEEYQEAPVIGRNTYFTTDQAGEGNLWAQCEKCSKWRKLPVDACLKFRWSCSDNIWDADRLSCSAAQELTVDQLASLISSKAGTSRKVVVGRKMGNNRVSDGLDTLANLAIFGEGQDNPHTTKHPRHRLGCTCIICIQPPSGKRPKHLPNCTCSVCLTVKCRFKTLALRREQCQSKNKAVKKNQLLTANAEPSQHSKSNSTPGHEDNSSPTACKPNDGTVDRIQHSKTLSPPLEAQQIDLNIQPAWDEEPLLGYENRC